MSFSSLRRRFWKSVAPLIPHRSVFGRIVRTRGCKTPPSETALLECIGRMQQLFLDFDLTTEVLVLGNSHTYYSIAPTADCPLRLWNAAYNGGDLFMAYHTYLALRDKWPHAPGQIVLVNEDFFAGAYQAEYSFLYWVASVAHVIGGIPMRDHRLLALFLRKIKRLAVTRQPTHTVRGYDPSPRPVPVESKTPVARIQGHVHMALALPQTELTWQERLRAAVEADGRRLVLFRSPLRTDYRAVWKDAAAGRDVYAPGAKAREGLPVLDYTTADIPTEGWANADHLTDAGAKHLTHRLIADLQALRTAQ